MFTKLSSGYYVLIEQKNIFYCLCIYENLSRPPFINNLFPFLALKVHLAVGSPIWHSNGIKSFHNQQKCKSQHTILCLWERLTLNDVKFFHLPNPIPQQRQIMLFIQIADSLQSKCQLNGTKLLNFSSVKIKIYLRFQSCNRNQDY